MSIYNVSLCFACGTRHVYFLVILFCVIFYVIFIHFPTKMTENWLQFSFSNFWHNASAVPSLLFIIIVNYCSVLLEAGLTWEMM